MQMLHLILPRHMVAVSCLEDIFLHQEQPLPYKSAPPRFQTRLLEEHAQRDGVPGLACRGNHT
jgi:hypothetical protein